MVLIIYEGGMLREDRTMYNVLTDTEKKQLARVKTTKKQARAIKKRNKTVLRLAKHWLKNFEKIRTATFKDFENECLKYATYSFDLGCPHCKYLVGMYFCNGCAWTKAAGVRCRFACTKQSFGGYRFAKLVNFKYFGIGLSVNSIELICDNLAGWRKNNQRPKKELNACIIFLQGHIQWADAVISGEIKDWEAAKC